jgi:hypothetical protein
VQGAAAEELVRPSCRCGEGDKPATGAMERRHPVQADLTDLRGWVGSSESNPTNECPLAHPGLNAGS